jgi:hypothetical protein
MSSPSKRRAAVATARLLSLALAAALAAGCAGGGRLSKDEYVAKLRALESSGLAREATRIYDRMAGLALPQGECIDNARTFHADLQTIVDEVHGLSPPAEVQRIQDDFVSAGQDTVDVIGRIVRDIEAGTLKCGQAFNRRAYGLPSTDRAQQALRELGRHGYHIGLNSGD